MAYTINLTDGSVFATVADGTINTASSVTLVGKNYAGYGEFLDENFIQMLENYSNTTAPTAPLTGQLWWDKGNNLLKVYNGTTFKTISVATAGASQPSSNVTGDLWYDTTNQQVKVWTGAAWLVVGPAYTSATGTAGAIPETINDNTATPHYVTTIYVNNTRVAIYNDGATFTAAAPVSTLFPTVYKGMTMTNASGTNVGGNLIGAGNVVITTAGSNTVATFTGTGANITGYTTVSGNVSGGNVLTGGVLSATGNVYGANFVGNVISPAGSNVSTTGNVTGGNILTGGLISATSTISSAANITGANILTGGIVSASGNVYGNYFVGNIILPAGSNVSTTGNVIGGNILTSGLVSATGNITSNSFVFGNAFYMTGISAAVSVSQIQNGTSNVKIGSTDGNVTIGVGGTNNVIVVDTTTLYANVVSAQSIAKTGSNGVGNIGSSSSYFNRLFATATTALYADVAERFAADEMLEAGTVVELGGTAEITKSREELSENVFGVISTNAAYLMNGGAGENDTHPPVAMTGRVPVKVTGIVRKGDRLVAAGSGIARAAQPGEATAFNVIGRSLVDKTTPESGTIEAIVTIKN
jgi:hypothetical protein